MRINSLYAKILLSFFAALAAVVICIILLFFYLVEGRLEDEVDSEMLAALRLTSTGIHLLAREESRDNPDAYAELQVYIDDLEVVFEGPFWLSNADGTVFMSSNRKPVPHFEIKRSHTDQLLTYEEVVSSGYSYHFSYPVTFYGYKGRLELLCRDDIYYNKHVALTFFWIVFAVSIFTVLLAFPVVRRITVPLRRLEEGALQCAAGDLTCRVDIQRGDELGRVAKAFNTMADSVEDMFFMNQELMANVSHELRSPLARIRVSLELAEMHIAAKRESKVLRHIGLIHQEVEDLDEVIGGVLALSRYGLERRNMVFERCDLVQIAKSVVKRYQPAMEMKKLKLVVDVPESVMVGCRQEALTVAIKNVIENAVKFTKKYGRVQLRITVRENDVMLSIFNTYRKLSGKELVSVFQPFARAEGGNVPGTGLGLALVEKIVAGHNGSVVARNVSSGVEFVIQLPVWQESG